jgi:hypothetical protein
MQVRAIHLQTCFKPLLLWGGGGGVVKSVCDVQEFGLRRRHICEKSSQRECLAIGREHGDGYIFLVERYPLFGSVSESDYGCVTMYKSRASFLCVHYCLIVGRPHYKTFKEK